MPAVKQYNMHPLEFDPKLVAKVMRRREAGESLGQHRSGVEGDAWQGCHG